MSKSAAILRSYDNAALKSSQFVSSVSGKKTSINKIKKLKSFGAIGFITMIIIVFALFFGSGNIIPSAISDRLIEEFDVQYADAEKSKELVFQQAMYQGKIPENTKRILEEKGVETLQAEDGTISLKMGEKTITASEFTHEVSTNVELYNAFTQATYGRAAYYYDEAAEKVFEKIGTNRNNYTEDSDYSEVMNEKMGDGSDINVNSVSVVKKTRRNEDTGREEEYYDYEESGVAANSKSTASEFINEVRVKNPASSASESALFAANALNTADTISKEERSSIFFALFMENISKMKAGEGNESKINEAMNFLYEKKESEVLDVKTGEVVKSYGTALDSPSLYAVLSGSKVNVDDVENYSSDRILKTVENKLGVTDSGNTISGTVASSSKKKGSIGRFISSGIEIASRELLNILEPTVSSSLVDNSYETINGIKAGEFLVEGAANVGKELAKASGASAGDSAAVEQYARLNTEVIAMDIKADRLNRSPFDTSSKNTFLGSILYNLAVNLRYNHPSVLSGFSTIINSTKTATLALLPTVSAEDNYNGYLSSFGNCETYEKINAVGSPQCSLDVTFDTSTLNDTFNDPGFIDFINKNTTLNSNGERVINDTSVLADYIKYNNERTTSLGIVDGGILGALKNGSSSIQFTSNIVEMVKNLLGSSDREKRIASGAAFVNTDKNPDWQTYKYAQRYVSLARATAALKHFSDDSTAYNNIVFFEGDTNPVTAFLNDYYLAINN